MQLWPWRSAALSSGSSAGRLAARHEALLLDPVYTGKVMAAVLERAGDADGTVLFIHTGGTPALFAYQHDLTDSTTPL